MRTKSGTIRVQSGSHADVHRLTEERKLQSEVNRLMRTFGRRAVAGTKNEQSSHVSPDRSEAA